MVAPVSQLGVSNRHSLSISDATGLPRVMIQYRYKAYDKSGRVVRGAMVAANERDLYQRCTTMGLELVSCRQRLSEGGWMARLMPGGSLPSITERAQVMTFLAELTAAGVTLPEALGDIRDSAETPAVRLLTAQLLQDVSDGLALSEAFQRQSALNNPVLLSLLSIGENTGDLSLSFQLMARHLTQMAENRRRLIRATRYPLFLLGMVVIALGVIVGFTVPRLAGLFQTMSTDLPPSTRLLVGMSQVISEGWPFILAVGLSVWLGVRILRRKSDSAALFLDRAVLRLPLIGRLIRRAAMGRFCRGFAIMFGARIGILECLHALGSQITNRFLSDQMATVERQVRDGVSLSDALGATGQMPPTMVRMVSLAEESGALEQGMERAADRFEREADEGTAALIAAAQPMLLLVVAGVMIWMVIAVFLPVWSLGELTDMANGL
ncbi:MAG: type II secretion system F family protein [Alphaproteobacteria bacterium]